VTVNQFGDARSSRVMTRTASHNSALSLGSCISAAVTVFLTDKKSIGLYLSRGQLRTQLAPFRLGH
jgi:hypothetical protein